MFRLSTKQFSLPCGLVLLLALIVADACTGDMHISLLHPGEAELAVLLKLRLPRIATAVIAGAALSLSGLQMQSVFRNPLADPHIMGISGGAGLGAALAIMAGTASGIAAGHIATVIAALFGAMVAALAVISVSRKFGDSSTILIFGVLVGFITSAATSILSYTADEHSLRMFYSWSAGSYSANSGAGLGIMALALVAGTIGALINSGRLDAILFGDQYAILCGTDPKLTRTIAMASCCLMTGAVTAFCGPIGFVGIVSPHIARWLTGTAVHRRIIPMTTVTGACVSLFADLLSQASHARIPVGSTMALIGIPVIVYILTRREHA